LILICQLDVVGVAVLPVERLDGAGHAGVVLGAAGGGKSSVVVTRNLSHLKK